MSTWEQQQAAAKAVADTVDAELIATKIARDDALDQRNAAQESARNLAGERDILATERDVLRGDVRTLTAERDALLARVAELEAQVPPAEQVPTLLGCGAGTVATYPQRQARYGARGHYEYNSGQAQPSFARVAAIPDADTIWFQELGTTREQFVASLATFPSARAGRVNVMPKNEPESKMSAAAFEANLVTPLFAAIDAAGLPYVRKSVNLMAWTLFPASGRVPADWAVQGLDELGFSVYASAGVKNGATVAKLDPQQQVDLIDAFLAEHYGPEVEWSAPAFGMPIIAGTEGPTSQANRLAWVQASLDAFRTMSRPPTFVGWYDYLQGNANPVLDYRTDNDPDLVAVLREFNGL